MQCPECGRTKAEGAKFCSFCGNPLEPASSGLQGREREQREVGDVNEDVDTVLKEQGSEIDDLLREADAAAERADEDVDALIFGGEVSTPVSGMETEKSLDKRDACQARMKGSGAKVGKRFLLHENELLGFLRPVPGQIRQAFEMVVSSPHITTNAVYSQLLKDVRFYFDAGNPAVNAFASHYEVELSSGEATKAPCIVMLGGMAGVLQVMAASLGLWALYREEHEIYDGDIVLRKVAVRLGKEVVENGGIFTEETMTGIYEELIFPGGAYGKLAGSGHLSSKDTKLVSRARSYLMAMTMSMVAHEAGHIALGHTLGKALNYDISRNEERAADGFASSVLSSSPFSDYLVTGQIMSWVLMAWVDHAAASSEAVTHPLAVDRLESVLRDNSVAAKDVGLTRETLGKWLPQAKRG